MSMQMLTYLSGGLPGLILSAGTGDRVPLRRPAGDRRHAQHGHLRRLHGLSDAVPVAAPGADGPVHELRHRPGVVPPRLRASSTCRWKCASSPMRRRVAAVTRRASSSTTSRCPSAADGRCSTGSRSASMPAKSLAIVGPSGSGKSTIADLLLRQLIPTPASSGSMVTTSATSGSPTCAGTSRWWIRNRACCTPRSSRTSATPGPMRPTKRWSGRSRRAALEPFIAQSAAAVRHRRRRARHGAVGRRTAAAGDRAGVPRAIRRC